MSPAESGRSEGAEDSFQNNMSKSRLAAQNIAGVESIAR